MYFVTLNISLNYISARLFIKLISHLINYTVINFEYIFEGHNNQCVSEEMSTINISGIRLPSVIIPKQTP
jgi:hypothetical protein